MLHNDQERRELADLRYKLDSMRAAVIDHLGLHQTASPSQDVQQSAHSDAETRTQLKSNGDAGTPRNWLSTGQTHDLENRSSDAATEPASPVGIASIPNLAPPSPRSDNTEIPRSMTIIAPLSQLQTSREASQPDWTTAPGDYHKTEPEGARIKSAAGEEIIPERGFWRVILKKFAFWRT
jgi:hypothetical protein